MSYRRAVALVVALGLGACGGSGGGGGGGGGGGTPINLTTFQFAGDIVGQTTANGTTANNGAGPGTPNQIGLQDPTGHVAEGSVYVVDGANHRVLGWNAVPTGLGQPADFVVGQSLFTTSNQGANATGLNQPRSCWAASGALFIADTFNNRVVVHAPPPTSNTAASFVLGKPDLTTVGQTQGQNGLNLPNDVCVAANRIVVADSGNNRVMIWNGIPAVSGTNAQVVVGQPDFTTTTAGVAANKMNLPTGVWTDGVRLAVADNGNHRVLVWTTFPTSNGQAPDVVVGQTDLTSNSAGTGAQKLNGPSSVASDGTRLFVTDTNNNRLLVFTPFPTTTNPAATGVLGQNGFTNVAPNDDDQNGVTDAATARTLNLPFGVTAVGPRLFVADSGNHRVLVFQGN